MSSIHSLSPTSIARTSASALMMESGVRRSCPASITNCRWLSCARTMGCTIRFESSRKITVTTTTPAP